MYSVTLDARMMTRGWRLKRDISSMGSNLFVMNFRRTIRTMDGKV